MRFHGSMRKLLFLLIALVASTAAASDISRATVIDQMNLRRAEAGFPPLREDARLDQAADDRITDMEEQGYWAHFSPDGASPFRWLKPHGYDFRYAGENLAAGFDTAEVLVDAWMESSGHRANILSPIYQDCGVSIVEGSTLGRAAGKSIVVIFARSTP